MTAQERLEGALRNLEQAQEDIIDSWGCENANERAAMLMCALSYVQGAIVDVTLVRTEAQARSKITEAT